MLRSRVTAACIRHGVAINAENPLRLAFSEIGADAATPKAHFAQPGSIELMEAVDQYAQGQGGRHVYSAGNVRV